MSDRLERKGPEPSGARALLWVLMALVAVASCVAIKVGIDEIRLIAAGDRQQLQAQALGPSTRGWLEVHGCIRHDLAVRVTPAGQAFALAQKSDAASSRDLVFTPLASTEECDEQVRPSRVLALIEDDEAIDNTMGYAVAARVAAPPIAAMVEGVIGYGVGSRLRSSRARALQPELAGLDTAPLLVKGRRPGVLWASIVTALAGAHGLVLIGVAAWWARRRMRRARAIRTGETTETEEEFFRSETLE